MPNTSDTISHDDFQAQLIARAWKDAAFKQALLRDPKGTLAKEFGVPMPEGVDIKVLEESADTLYLVLPSNPAEDWGESEMSEEELAAVAGGGNTLRPLGAPMCCGYRKKGARPISRVC